MNKLYDIVEEVSIEENHIPVPVKLWASGGCTGYSDYLMSDGSIQTLKYTEPWAGSIN